MPSVETQTDETYVVIEDPTYICNMTTMRIRQHICIFFQYSHDDITTTDKNTMTQYNSENDEDMDMFIAQLKAAGDF